MVFPFWTGKEFVDLPRVEPHFLGAAARFSYPIIRSLQQILPGRYKKEE
jgi:hypothetical protein